MSHHTPEPETAAPPSPAAHDTAPAADRAGHVEQHGIDVIPASDRHGRPRELFWVWMSANVNYLYFVLGGVLVLLGLSIWEALAITVIGNLWWAAVGWLAVSGPASGTPSVAIMRAMFGVRGNRVFGGGLGVAIGLFYEIINIAVATLAANALLGILGVPLPAGAEWIVLVVVAVLSFVLSVYGHATILKLAPVFSAALAVAFVVLAVFVLGAADLSYSRPRCRSPTTGRCSCSATRSSPRARSRGAPAPTTPATCRRTRRSARSPGGPRSAASSPPCSSAPSASSRPPRST